MKRFPEENGKTTFGLHLMLDAYEADEAKMADMKNVFHFLYSLPEMIGMSRLGLPMVVNADETASGFDPGGITGITLINESHISIHTFPKRGFFTMDLYSCSDFEEEIQTILDFAKESFGYGTHELQVVKRGLDYPTENLAS